MSTKPPTGKHLTTSRALFLLSDRFWGGKTVACMSMKGPTANHLSTFRALLRLFSRTTVSRMHTQGPTANHLTTSRALRLFLGVCQTPLSCMFIKHPTAQHLTASGALLRLLLLIPPRTSLLLVHANGPFGTQLMACGALSLPPSYPRKTVFRVSLTGSNSTT